MQSKRPATEPDGYTVNGVNLRRSDWKLLRRVAEVRADLRGGRPSVSKVLESLIERNRARLERDILKD